MPRHRRCGLRPPAAMQTRRTASGPTRRVIRVSDELRHVTPCCSRTSSSAPGDTSAVRDWARSAWSLWRLVEGVGGVELAEAFVVVAEVLEEDDDRVLAEERRHAVDVGRACPTGRSGSPRR